jgi:hypothetical protein
MMDFDDVLNDPELGACELIRIRVDQLPAARGRSVNRETPYPFSGIVTQDKGAIMARAADGNYVDGSILVTSSCPLRMKGATVDADRVMYKGARYVVSTIADYSAHGVSFAVCEPLGIGL